MRRGILFSLLLTLIAVPAPAQTPEGVLTVVHGIPDVKVDVCARGDVTGGEFVKLVPDFDFTETETLVLPEGVYDARVVLFDDDCSNPVPGLDAPDLFLPGGADVSVVANLVPSGGFGLNVFVNDTSELRFAGQLVFRHTAAAPAVDAKFGRFFPIRTVPDLSFGDEGAAFTFPGTFQVAVNAAGTMNTVLGPAPVEVERSASTIVYVVGSLADDNLDVILQTVDRSPSGFPGGDDEDEDEDDD